MEKQHEIIQVRAHCLPLEGFELYWLFGKSQLEFVLKDIELFASPSRVSTTRYGDKMVPVISLEKYFGIEVKYENIDKKYLVIRAVNEKNEMIKLIIQTIHSLQVQKLGMEFTARSSVHFPDNRGAILGTYSLPGNKIVVVPDIVKIFQAFKLMEN
jgi:hypothetical protein